MLKKLWVNVKWNERLCMKIMFLRSCLPSGATQRWCGISVRHLTCSFCSLPARKGWQQKLLEYWKKKEWQMRNSRAGFEISLLRSTQCEIEQFRLSQSSCDSLDVIFTRSPPRLALVCQTEIFISSNIIFLFQEKGRKQKLERRLSSKFGCRIRKVPLSCRTDKNLSEFNLFREYFIRRKCRVFWWIWWIQCVAGLNENGCDKTCKILWKPMAREYTKMGRK